MMSGSKEGSKEGALFESMKIPLSTSESMPYTGCSLLVQWNKTSGIEHGATRSLSFC